MTTPRTADHTHTPQTRFRLPDPPPRHPDEMTSYDKLSITGNVHHLVQHFGSPDTTLVAADRWIAQEPHPGVQGLRRPDLLIAFNVYPAAYIESNGYIISEQGKPPDFVLEIASPSTAQIDTGPKREEYAALGIPSTGALTRRANITERGWPATGWSTASTNPFRSSRWRMMSGRVTAPR